MKLTTTHLELNGKLYTQTEAIEVKEIDNDIYKKIVESSPFFRRLGGTERHTKNYTSQGYKVVKIVSTSPDKKNRTIREFSFD